MALRSRQLREPGFRGAPAAAAPPFIDTRDSDFGTGIGIGIGIGVDLGQRLHWHMSAENVDFESDTDPDSDTDPENPWSLPWEVSEELRR